MAVNIAELYYNLFLNKIVSAIILFFIGFMIAKIFHSMSKTILEDIHFNKISGYIFPRLNFEKILSNMIAATVYMITIILVLNTLGITNFVINGILLFFILILLFGLILEAKDFFPNIYGWIKITTKHTINEGDVIKTNLTEGVVKRIYLRTTKIITSSNDEIYIPNSTLIDNFALKK